MNKDVINKIAEQIIDTKKLAILIENIKKEEQARVKANIAYQMLKDKELSIKQIAKYTELTEKEIANITKPQEKSEETITSTQKTEDFKSSALSDPGISDKTNEDSYIVDDEQGVYVISDGLGSYEGADTVSQLIAETASAAAPKTISHKNDLSKIVRRTVTAVNQKAKEEPSLGSMSGTLTLLKISDEKFYMVQIGDSRGYLFRNGELNQITQDHSVAFEQYKIGAITKEEIQNHPNQKFLTRTISAGKDFAVSDIHEEKLCPKDIFLLCSDGLTKVLTDNQICEIIKSSDFDNICLNLVDAVHKKGASDNITVIIAGKNE